MLSLMHRNLHFKNKSFVGGSQAVSSTRDWLNSCRGEPLLRVYHSCPSASLDSFMIVVSCSYPSGPMRAYVLAREDAIRHWRELMGPTKVFQARHTSPTSIRAEFGLTDTRNTTHGSGRNSLCILRCSQINSKSTQTTFCHRMISAEYSFS